MASLDEEDQEHPVDEHPVDEEEEDEGAEPDVDDGELAEHPSDEHGSSKKGRKKRDAHALRKAPQAPKRFKSSYICFFMAKQPEIKEELGTEATVTAISKRSAEMWKNLPPAERAHWDDVAAKDKQRYMVEKASYTGPWQVPWKRAKKDPSAPKRPMSAFLYFSQGKRTRMKQEQPEMKNTEISRRLGEMWRSLSDDERRPYVDKEKHEREKYKVAIAEWRKDSEKRQEAQRQAQAQQVEQSNAASVPQLGDNSNVQHPPAPPLPPQSQQQMAPMPYGGEHYGQPPPPMAPAPFMYPPPYCYSYGPNPYQFPTNGKQPIVLGPNGMPVGPNGMPVGPNGAPHYPSPYAGYHPQPPHHPQAPIQQQQQQQQQPPHPHQHNQHQSHHQSQQQPQYQPQQQPHHQPQQQPHHQPQQPHRYHYPQHMQHVQPPGQHGSPPRGSPSSRCDPNQLDYPASAGNGEPTIAK